MHKGFLKTACILAALTVALGAFGAHALKNFVSNNALATFETGVRYQFYHVFALLLTGILYKDFSGRVTKVAGWLFITGIILFSGSLYMMAVLQATVQPGFRWIGAITPFGGTCFIAGWLCLLGSFFKREPSPRFTK